MTAFFTRETWRAGKRSKLRKRVNGYGGCKTAPAAFLAAAKLAAIKPGRSNRRLCSAIKRDGTPCRRLAMKGCRGCEAHGGIRMLAMQGKFQPSGRTAAFKAARAAAVEGRSPQVPFELIRLSVYRQANELDASAIGESVGDDGLAAVGAPNSVSTIISNFVFEAPHGASWSPLRNALRYRRVDGGSRPGVSARPWNETAQAAPGALGIANSNCRSLAMCNTPPSSSTT